MPVKVHAFEKKIIYVYKHIDVESHKGWLKVGETKLSRIARDGNILRIIEQHEASNVAYDVLYTTPAATNDGRAFSDNDIHRKLIEQNIERETTANPRTNRKSEWFKTDIETVIRTIDNFKANTKVDSTGTITDFTLRSEQYDAIETTATYFERTIEEGNLQPEFLWNAKPRFGKTLTAYCFAQKIKAKKVLIITNRPAIADSWFSDFQRFDFKYTDQTDGKHRWIFTASESVRNNLSNITGSSNIRTRDEQIQNNDKYLNFIHFISLQDIKGQNESADRYKERNQWIFSNNDQEGIEWDLLIIDESHEGVDTHKSFRVLENVKYKFALHLSGTPFKALASNKFNSNQIFNWSYTDEQSAKSEWNLEDGNNPYACLPKLNIFTYQLSRAIQLKAEEAKDEGSEYAFDLGEFFRAVKEDGKDKFAYEDKIKLFLDNLVNPKFQYPFSNKDYLDSLRHTFWLLPGVASCKLMKQMLAEHEFFREYKIILAAGNGDEDRITNTALEEVRAAINGNSNDKHPLETKTITLSCGQLTTGVTVPAWTAVLMLNNVKSPAQYMQTAFRAQNPFETATSGGETFTKENCYVFDFAPDRILQTLAEMADSGVSDTSASRESKVQRLINFLPVIAEDDEGRMHELDANEVLTIPLKLITAEVVSRGFMSNRLFENISGIFGAPQSVMDIINKMNPDEGGKVGNSSNNPLTNKPRIWVDKENRIHINEDIVVNTSNGLLGDKQYVEIGTDEEKEVLAIKQDVATALRNKNIPAASANVVIKVLEKKLPKVVAKIPDPAPQPGDPDYHRPESPDEKPAPKEKSEEEKTRDRLRGFARTIPSFLMAYGDTNTTIANFESNIPDDVFQDLTSITKDEFKKLRDGFEYDATSEETGKTEKCRFEGLFNESVFNASVQAFLNKRAELADYYLSDHTEDIFEYIPPQATNQIFTPKRVVKMMIDALEKHSPDLFKRTDSTFIDLYMKSGLYITEIVKRLFANTRSQYKSDAECVKYILENQVYGLAPTGVLHAITNSLIFGFDESHTISTKNFAQIDFLPYAKGTADKSGQQKLNEIFNKGNDMKFDAVVGNPPFQESEEKTESQSQANSKWVYYLFQDMADKIGDRSSLIYPFGGWFDNNKEYKGFGKRILSDGHTVSINAFEGTSDRRAWYRNDKSPKPIFGENVNLSAGVSIVTRDQTNTYKTFKYSNRMYSDATRNVSVDEWYSLSPNPDFTVGIKLSGDRLEKYVSNKTFGIESDFIEKNPKLFSLNPSDFKDPIKLLTNDKSGSAGRAKWFYINRTTIEKNVDLIDEYKVAMPSAYPKKTLVSGVPTIDNVLNRASEIIKIFKPKEVFGRSKMLIYHSPKKADVDNFMKYIQTRFFAYMVLNEPNRSFSFGFIIPLLNFTVNSDIDWSKTIAEIDQQLYGKYGLSNQEIDFIETHIKPME